jgi:hypothetical protein
VTSLNARQSKVVNKPRLSDSWHSGDHSSLQVFVVLKKLGHFFVCVSHQHGHVSIHAASISIPRRQGFHSCGRVAFVEFAKKLLQLGRRRPNGIAKLVAD